MAEAMQISMTEDKRRLRRLGAQYQDWVDDPSSKGCRVAPATLTRERLLGRSTGSNHFKMEEESFTDAPEPYLAGGDPESMNIASGMVYLETHATGESMNTESLSVNSYYHIMGPGVIMATSISRNSGPHWNEIAKALYDATFKIQTLTHIIFNDVVNPETLGYIEDELYPKCRSMVLNDSHRDDYLELEHGSPEYQEILGTTLGRAAVRLVLSSFPRGSVCIPRAITWRSIYDTPTLRIDIEPV